MSNTAPPNSRIRLIFNAARQIMRDAAGVVGVLVFFFVVFSPYLLFP